MSNYILTTTDNPWDPTSHFDEWWAWDVGHGYGTCSYLARVVCTSSDLPDSTNSVILDDAIDEIVKKDLIALITDGKVHYKKLPAEPVT